MPKVDMVSARSRLHMGMHKSETCARLLACFSIKIEDYDTTDSSGDDSPRRWSIGFLPVQDLFGRCPAGLESLPSQPLRLPIRVGLAGLWRLFLLIERKDRPLKLLERYQRHLM